MSGEYSTEAPKKAVTLSPEDTKRFLRLAQAVTVPAEIEPQPVDILTARPEVYPTVERGVN